MNKSQELILTKYIFSNQSSIEVRRKALNVLIRNFNQRDILIKELSKTQIVVNQ